MRIFMLAAVALVPGCTLLEPVPQPTQAEIDLYYVTGARLEIECAKNEDPSVCNEWQDYRNRHDAGAVWGGNRWTVDYAAWAAEYPNKVPQ